MLLASAVPVKVGVVSLVRLSLLDAPVSESAARSGTEGAAGAVLSMVMERLGDAASALPATSKGFAVKLWFPSPSAVLTVKLQSPVVG